MKFYRCEGCGNFITFMNEKSGCTPKCCGETMKELVPNTTDGATEKHVPVVEVEGNVVRVTVGSVEHPMSEAHYIQWIVLETNKGFIKHDLKTTDQPKSTFYLSEDEKVVSAYEYCNLHGLWKKEL